MDRSKITTLIAVGVVCVSGRCQAVTAQVGPRVAPSAPAIEISAQELGKPYALDNVASVTPHQNRILRVSGRVSMAHDPFIYLGTDSTFPTGQPVKITLEYKAGAMPRVSVGDRIIVEGRLERTGIFGPILTECRLVRREPDAKAPSIPQVAVKKGRVPSTAGGRSIDPGLPTPMADPRGVALRFDGPVREGETGFRPDHTSFRLRFGPGKWRGTVIGPSIAWGDGNSGKDYWGVGSGEVTSSSEVYQDSAGDYFIFSLHGTDWESDRVVAIFRLTLADGRPGVATALIPVDKNP